MTARASVPPSALPEPVVADETPVPALDTGTRRPAAARRTALPCPGRTARRSTTLQQPTVKRFIGIQPDPRERDISYELKRLLREFVFDTACAGRQRPYCLSVAPPRLPVVGVSHSAVRERSTTCRNRSVGTDHGIMAALIFPFSPRSRRVGSARVGRALVGSVSASVCYCPTRTKVNSVVIGIRSRTRSRSRPQGRCDGRRPVHASIWRQCKIVA